MLCSEKNKIIEYIERNLTEKRRNHTYGVVRQAKTLAQLYGADTEKAEIASLFHDLFRGLSANALNEYVSLFGLGEQYINNSNLVHSKIAAYIMKKDYNIDDQDILNAVSYHTTGRADMSLLEKIIFIADAIEPGRNYPGVEELREMANKDLDRACFLALNHSIEYVKSQGLYLDQDTIKARDSLLKKLERRENGNE